MTTEPASPPKKQIWSPPPPGGSVPPPTPPRRSLFVPFGSADFIGFALVAVLLTVLDAAFMAVGRHSDNVALFVLWFCLQAIVCIGGGVLQAVRRRGWWEIAIVGATAAALLAFIILVMVNPEAGSADCSSQGPCDTSFGLGAILIFIVTFPLFAGMAGIGRALGGFAARGSGRGPDPTAM